jgi:hypothetical protein
MPFAPGEPGRYVVHCAEGDGRHHHAVDRGFERFAFTDTENVKELASVG